MKVPGQLGRYVAIFIVVPLLLFCAMRKPDSYALTARIRNAGPQSRRLTTQASPNPAPKRRPTPPTFVPDCRDRSAREGSSAHTQTTLSHAGV